MGRPVTLSSNVTVVTTEWLQQVENLASAYLNHPVNNLTSKEEPTIDFHSCPDVLSNNSTPSMTLRCSLRDPKLTPGQGHTPPRLEHLESIVVSRGQGQTVADLTFFNDPEVKVDLDKLSVTGTLTGGKDGRGYIELTWQHPSDVQSGNYRCDVTGIDVTGQQVTLTSSLHVYTDQQLSNLTSMASLYQKEQKSKEIGQVELLKTP